MHLINTFTSVCFFFKFSKSKPRKRKHIPTFLHCKIINLKTHLSIQCQHRESDKIKLQFFREKTISEVHTHSPSASFFFFFFPSSFCCRGRDSTSNFLRVLFNIVCKGENTRSRIKWAERFCAQSILSNFGLVFYGSKRFGLKFF